MAAKQYGDPSKVRMNILFFSRLFYPHIGGVEKHVLEISKILLKKGHGVVVVTEKHDETLKDKDNIEGIEIYRIDVGENEWFKKFKIWSWLFKHRDLIKNADIIHCHDVFFWYLPFRFLFLFKKVFTTFHGYEGYPLKTKNVFMRKISEKLSSGNICVGDFIKKWYGTKPSYITYGAVGISNYKSQIPNKVNQESAVFIGRLDDQTGIKTYTNAVRLIKKTIPSFKFEIIGDGKFRIQIEKDFEVLGFQNNPDRYLSRYNFAFVSRYLSILEAMATKRLVFAVYDNPIKEDYLKMSPFANLINIVSSEDELAEKVIYFLKYKDKEGEMVNKAYDWVKTKTWESLAGQYLTLWNSV